jgi:hypothetical protein
MSPNGSMNSRVPPPVSANDDWPYQRTCMPPRLAQPSSPPPISTGGGDFAGAGLRFGFGVVLTGRLPQRR